MNILKYIPVVCMGLGLSLVIPAWYLGAMHGAAALKASQMQQQQRAAQQASAAKKKKKVVATKKVVKKSAGQDDDAHGGAVNISQFLSDLSGRRISEFDRQRQLIIKMLQQVERKIDSGVILLDRAKIGQRLKKRFEKRDDQGRTFLICAVQEGDFTSADLLIAYGAPVDAYDYQSKTPLHYAAQAGDKAMVNLLLDGGASTTLLDADKKTAQDLASDELKPLFDQQRSSATEFGYGENRSIAQVYGAQKDPYAVSGYEVDKAADVYGASTSVDQIYGGK